VYFILIDRTEKFCSEKMAAHPPFLSSYRSLSTDDFHRKEQLQKKYTQIHENDEAKTILVCLISTNFDQNASANLR
jgi:hypothetical protein